MKILLVRNDNIGDLICTTPSIEALRKKNPNAQIDIVVNSYNYIAISNNPFVDNIYVYTKPKHKKKFSDKVKALFGKIKVFYEIRKMKYDVCVVFRGDYSPSAEQFSNISGANMKIGVKGENDKFTHHVEVDNNKHEVLFCFDCLKFLDVEYNSEKTFFYVNEKLSKQFEYLEEYPLFHISSRVKENKLSYEKLSIILNSVGKIYITAEPIDWEIAKKLENKNVKFLKTNSLDELAGAIKQAKLFISLDGGALHIGPAVGTKTIGIYGKTNTKKWYPWGYKNLVLQDKSKIAENIDNDKIIEMIEDNL